MRATFELVDRHGQLAAVRLLQEIGLDGPLAFTRSRGVWRLSVTVPDVWRMEYLFEVEDHNGRRTTITDPGNPRRVGGAFGEKSEMVFADYQPPAWTDVVPVAGQLSDVDIEAPELDATLGATLWSPMNLDAAQPAPLLVVHDGPEYARIGGFTHYVGAGIATGSLPLVRVALLGPGDRNTWYSANADYAAALCAGMAELAPATARIGVGVSLGGLALLHAHRSYPGTFDALLLQSGSFFTPRLDSQESTFSGFRAVTSFVAEVTKASADPAPVPTVLTCGTVEENYANNEAIAAELDRLGYPTTFVPVRDAHNYTAWRDALDPHLTQLITDVVGAHAA